jgi:integrase
MWKNMEKWLITNKLRYAFFSFPLLSLLVFFHMARHTAATIVFLANDVSMENVSKILGHSNIRMTQHYAKVLDSSIMRDMVNVEKNFK